MKYLKHVQQGAIVACFFILIFQLDTFLSSEKTIDSLLAFMGQSIYNLGMVFLIGPLATIWVEKTMQDDDERVS